MTPEPILFCWSGGKDSALALHRLRRDPAFRIAGLLTTITDAYDRISMHGVRRSLLELQAERLGLPLRKVFIPPDCVNSVYEARMAEAMEQVHASGIRKVSFGDIFLEDLRAYREKNLARLGMTGVFPLWKQDTHRLAEEFVALGFRAIAVCIDTRVLPREFAGRELDASFFRELPASVDRCGENGEFHTFVFEGPIFSSPIAVTLGETRDHPPFLFRELIPQDSGH